MSSDKLEKVEKLVDQLRLRPVRVIDDQRQAEEAARPWKGLVDKVQWEMGEIQAVLWAADQLTLEHHDMTISRQEAADRVQRMVMLARKLVERLDDAIESERNSITHPERAGDQSAA